MARVPDLGSDFAQKLLQDLRRRRERLGFESSVQRTSNAAPRDAYSNSQKPLRGQKPLQGTPRVGRTEATTNRLSSNAIVRAGKLRHRDAPKAPSHDIVPFQGGGSKQKPANNIDVQMALALALSNSGKLQNIELVTRHGSIFFREPDRMHHRGDNLFTPNAHVGKVAIGVQKLNDTLMAYSSSAMDFSRRSSVEIGKQLFRGAMDLEESLSMLVMLQEASDYMEGSGNGKVLLLKGKENQKNLMHSPSSAKLVEIVDEDSGTDQAKDAKNSSNASLQIIAHKKSHSYSPSSSSVLQLSTVTSNYKSNASKGGKDDAKVRVPNVIAKLMGLEELPSAKAVVKHMGTEKFVKPAAVTRKDIRVNATGGKLPIHIVASERVSVKGQYKNSLAREQKNGFTNSEGSQIASSLSNSSSHPIVDKKARQTMKELLSKVESAASSSPNQGVHGKTIHEDKKTTEESKVKKVVKESVRSRKMDFLNKFRKNSDNRLATEEKHTHQEKNRILEKKQAANVKQLPGRDSEVKTRRTREKFNKENLSITEFKVAGHTDQMKRQSHDKQIGKQSITKKAQNYHEMRSETASLNLEGKRSVKVEPTHMKTKFAHVEVLQPENEKHTKVNDIGVSKASDDKHGDDCILQQSATEVKCSNTDEGVSSDQSLKQKTEATKDPTTAVAHTSEDSKVVYHTAPTETNDDSTNHTASVTKQMTETFTDRGEQQQQQQQQQQHKRIDVKEQPMEGLDQTKKSSNPTDSQDQKTLVISCDSFTENQRLLMEMLLKDHYLFETAKAIARIHVPVNVISAVSGKWSDKGHKVLSDIGQEVIRRKSKRNEAMVDVSMARPVNLKLQSLEDFIRELDDDIDSLNISKKTSQLNDDNTAQNLQMILLRDIQNRNPDANSMWDFGWNFLPYVPVEKYEVVRDVEKNILNGIITELARELIAVSSVCHVCCEA